jgi:hypothetical protein
MRKNLLYAKNMYIIKLFLNVVTDGIKALVLGDEILYVFVKQVCLGAQPCFDTLHHLLIIVEAL